MVVLLGLQAQESKVKYADKGLKLEPELPIHISEVDLMYNKSFHGIQFYFNGVVYLLSTWISLAFTDFQQANFIS